MKIELSPEVKDYLHKKHKDVLEVYARHVYYERLGEPVKQLEIHFGIPETGIADQFTAYDIEGFKVYIEKDLVDEQHDVLIKIGHVLGFKHLEVDGLK